VLCFTHGEASTLGPIGSALAAVRAAELAAAAGVLGVRSFRLLSYADGGLREAAFDELCGEVTMSVDEGSVDCLLVFDEGGITGHPDHQRATEVAVASAGPLALPVLAWAVPIAVATKLNREFGTGFVGRDPSEIDLVIEVDRRLQREAIACHSSQATDNPVLWRRLALQADTESLRWLGRAGSAP
jgi:LmbE family N-acetylglucosaminyl deacetylase